MASEISQFKVEGESSQGLIQEKNEQLNSFLLLINEKSTEIDILEKEISKQTTLSNKLTPLISKQQADVDRLALELVNTNEQIVELEQNTSKKTIQFNALTSSLSDQKDSLEQLLEQISELTQKQETFDDSTAVAERKETSLKSAKVMSERYALELAILEATEPCNELEAEITLQKDELESLKQSANNISQDHNALLEDLLSNTAKSDELQIPALIIRRDDLNKNLAEVEEDKTLLETELSNMTKTYDELMLSLSSKEVEYNELINILTIEQEELSSLVPDIEIDNLKKDEFTKTLELAGIDLKDLEHAIALDTTTSEVLQSEVVLLTETIDELNRKVSTASTDSGKLQYQLDIDTDELNGLENRLADLFREVEPFESVVQQDTIKQNELVNTIDLDVTKQSELEQSIAIDVAEQKELERVIETKNSNIESLQVVLLQTPDSLQVEIQQLIEKRAELESEITEKTAERDELVEFIDENTKEYEKLSSDISEKTQQSKEIKREIKNSTLCLDGESLFENEFDDQNNVGNQLSDTSDSVDGQITDDKLDFILKHSTQRYNLVSSGKLDVNKLLKEVVNLKSDILATEKGKCPRTIMVTSSVEGEGKTTTAIAMARSLANDSADKVLIISANSGKHALNRWYELDNEKIGFLELLSGAASMQDTVIHKTDLEQLDIMSCGKSGKVSTKNFDTDQLERLLDTLKNHYDFIIVDAPSILTSSSISLFMAQSFDGLVVVVRCNKTKKELVQKTVKTIEVLGANIIGVILNNKSNYIPRWLYNWI